MAGNVAAWDEMEKYNVMDVLSLEELYLKVRPWWSSHPNVSVYMEEDVLQCSCCGSQRLQSRGYSFTKTGKYRRYKCNDCGGWSRARFTELPKEKRKSLLTQDTRV